MRQINKQDGHKPIPTKRWVQNEGVTHEFMFSWPVALATKLDVSKKKKWCHGLHEPLIIGACLLPVSHVRK